MASFIIYFNLYTLLLVNHHELSNILFVKIPGSRLNPRRVKFPKKENTGHPKANQCFPEGRKLNISIVNSK